jgi:subtilisin family serine protease
MEIMKTLTAVVLGAALSLSMGVSAGLAQDTRLDFNELSRGKPGGGGSTTLPKLQNWMSPEIADAWSQGFQGQGVRITIIDDFTSNYGYYGNLGNGTQLLRHGEWVRAQAGMIAPSATLASQDFTSGTTVSLDRKRMNTLNLSYGMMAADGYTSVNWSRQESSIISYARNGSAVVVKAAGNDAVAVGAVNRNGLVDYLNRDLIGAQAAIFVGALDRNGTPSDLASMAWYSNTAGSNTIVQDQFLSVGVRGDLTNLYGTSFAAPVVSGYAAVLGSKFTKATPTQITNQLLDTARTDTILGYTRDIHGRGEASITRALAPVAIQ